MSTCRDCKFFTPHTDDSSKGDCFGQEVPADRPAEECPTSSFKPREEK